MTSEIERLFQVVPLLCRWYEANRKAMPWREDPTPYHVWISEIMLQQTRIEAAIPYYHRFLAELPDVKALAEISDERLMKLWQGLGYYSRARNLKKAAIAIMNEHDGVIPDDAKLLRSLPGIGDYTAGAIASIAYHRPEPAVDGNVLRVIMRLWACDDDVMLPATRRTVTDTLRHVYPSGREAALLTEGLMELGETVCIPNGAPRCELCPIKGFCKAYQEGTPDKFPIRSPKKERRIEKRTVLLLKCGNRYAVRKRPEAGLLANMWEFPNLDGHLTSDEVSEHLNALHIDHDSLASCGKAKHIFSHVEWHMSGYTVRCRSRHPSFDWITPTEASEEYAIPTAFKKYAAMLK